MVRVVNLKVVTIRRGSRSLRIDGVVREGRSILVCRPAVVVAVLNYS